MSFIDKLLQCVGVPTAETKPRYSPEQQKVWDRVTSYPLHAWTHESDSGQFHREETYKATDPNGTEIILRWSESDDRERIATSSCSLTIGSDYVPREWDWFVRELYGKVVGKLGPYLWEKQQQEHRRRLESDSAYRASYEAAEKAVAEKAKREQLRTKPWERL